MALRFIVLTSALAGISLYASLGRQDHVEQVLREKHSNVASSEEERKKLQFMNVLQRASHGSKPIYRLNKEEMDKYLH